MKYTLLALLLITTQIYAKTYDCTITHEMGGIDLHQDEYGNYYTGQSWERWDGVFEIEIINGCLRFTDIQTNKTTILSGSWKLKEN